MTPFAAMFVLTSGERANAKSAISLGKRVCVCVCMYVCGVCAHSSRDRDGRRDWDYRGGYGDSHGPPPGQDYGRPSGFQGIPPGTYNTVITSMSCMSGEWSNMKQLWDTGGADNSTQICNAMSQLLYCTQTI